MGIEIFGHAEATDSISAKNLGHLFVWGEKLLVFGILEVIFLQICPKLFDTFAPRKDK